uniref:G_PROTEIN_RECEP_F1_2 domain-containing protein n=1 Tax=Elaeophora elaphi TaxID=1147741 RepID=A0A0R3RN37_9BILA
LISPFLETALKVSCSFICFFLILLPSELILIYFKRRKKRWSTVNHTFSNVKTFTFYAALNFTFLLTLNRFAALILSKYNNFYESTKLHLLSLFALLSVSVTSFSDFYSCTRASHINPKKRKKLKRTGYESDCGSSMLIKAALTCGMIEIRTLGRLLRTFCHCLRLKCLMNIFINCYVILTHGVLPTVCFTYNKQARNIAKYLLLHLSLK